MNLINRLSQAIKNQKKPQGNWATHLVIALSFTVIAIGYMVYNTTQSEFVSAQTPEMSFMSPIGGETFYFGNSETIFLEGTLSTRPGETLPISLFACVADFTGNDAWYSGGGNWDYRQALIIDETEIPVDQTDFVLTVRIPVDNDLFANTLADGNDIVFVADDHLTKLDHDIEQFDQIKRIGTFRVRVPFVSATEITQLYMYYSNASASVQENPTGVYSGDHPYGLFYEMDISGADSTANGRDRIADVGLPIEDNTRLGLGVSFDGASAWTMEGMAYWEEEWSVRTHNVVFTTGSDIDTQQTLLAEGGGSNGTLLYIRNGHIYARWWSETLSWSGDYITTGISGPSPGGFLSANTTYYVTISYEFPGNYRLFVDGTEQFGPDGLDDNITSVAINAHGGDGGIAYTGLTSKDFDNGMFTGEYFTGIISQFEVLDEAWVDFQHAIWYNSLNDTSTFIQFGTQESPVPNGCLSPAIITGTVTTDDLGVFQFTYTWSAGHLDGLRITEDISQNNISIAAVVVLDGPAGNAEVFSNSFSVIDMSAVFDEPIGGEEWTIGSSQNISISGSYGEDVLTNRSFTISFDVCLEDTATCYSGLVNDIIINQPNINKQFQANTTWNNVGYLAGGTRMPGNLIDNVYLTANIFQTVSPVPMNYGNYDSNKFSLIEGVVSINIQNPTDTTSWNIGDPETIRWSTTVTGGEIIDYYKLQYSTNNGFSWDIINENVPHGMISPQTYIWEIPVVADDVVGLQQFQVKVDAYDPTDVLIGSSPSSAFIIDYGPVAALDLTSDMETAVDIPFTISLEVKDKYGNTITNFNETLDLSIMIGSGIGVLSPLTIGESGVSGTWDNGMVTYSGYTISAAGLYIINTTYSSSIGEVITGGTNIEVIENAVYIDAPTVGTTWYIGGNGDITFRANGITQPDFLKVFYTETPNIPDTWIVIDSFVPWDAAQPQTYTIIGIPDTIITPQFDIKVKVESYETGNTIPIAEGISNEFTIRSGGEALGEYITQEFLVDVDSSVFITSLDSFDAVADADSASDLESTLQLAIRFIDQDGNYFGPPGDGFYDVDFNETYTTLLDKFDSWLAIEEVRKIQFRVSMWTLDIALYQPWVESIQFDYTVQTSDVDIVATIEFNPAGDNHKFVDQSSSVDYNIIITPMDLYKDIVNQIQLDLSIDETTIDPLTNIEIPVVGIQVTANPNIINFDGSDSYASTITIQTNDVATPAEDIRFYIRILVLDPNRPDLVSSPDPLIGRVSVNGPTSTDDFSISMSGASDKSVRPGGTVSYNMVVSFIGGFDESITISSDIIDVFDAGVIENVEFLPSNVVTPLSNEIVEMRVTVSDSSAEYTRTEFNITGTPELSNAKTVSPKPALTISNDAPAYINIEATADVDGGVSSDKLNPKFSFRLYQEDETNTNSWTVHLDNLLASIVAGDEATVNIEIPTDEVTDGETYTGYLRSDRHLWRKATTPTGGNITINLSDLNYTLGFPELMAGDISPDTRDNIVNSLDFNRLITDFYRSMAGLLPDFDNNGRINTLDITYLFSNWFKVSELPGN